MDREDVEELEARTVYQGYFRIDRYQLRHALFDGGASRVLTRELFERGRVVAVLPVDLRSDRVVLIEQFRAGAYAAGWEPWLIECVAGVREAEESAEDVARRETAEEAGCRLGRLYPVMEFLSSPGGTTETVSLFCGEVDAAGVGGVHGLAEEGEDIRVLNVSRADAMDRLERGEIRNAKTIIVLQWLALNHRLLEAAWT